MHLRFTPLLPVLVLFAPGTALAQQLVTFDQVITITQQGNGSGAYHYTIKPAATEPASWTTPVDYSKGTAYILLDVMAKPSKRNTAITICFDGNLEGYGCIATKTYTDVGRVETMLSLPSATWQYGKIAWARRRQEYHLVVKDPALGGTPGGRPPSDYVPTTMRVVMTIVPPGGTYTPPPGGSSPATDAGASADSGGGAPPTADAGVTPPHADAASIPVTPSPDAAVAADTGSAPPKDAAPPRTDPPPTEDPPTTPTANRPAAGGCSVGAGSGAGGWWIAGLLLVVVLGRRRRR
jgi:MYXO-CTERM domain-containing protein